MGKFRAALFPRLRRRIRSAAHHVLNKREKDETGDNYMDDNEVEDSEMEDSEISENEIVGSEIEDGEISESENEMAEGEMKDSEMMKEDEENPTVCFHQFAKFPPEIQLIIGRLSITAWRSVHLHTEKKARVKLVRFKGMMSLDPDPLSPTLGNCIRHGDKWIPGWCPIAFIFTSFKFYHDLRNVFYKENDFRFGNDLVSHDYDLLMDFDRLEIKEANSFITCLVLGPRDIHFNAWGLFGMLPSLRHFPNLRTLRFCGLKDMIYTQSEKLQESVQTITDAVHSIRHIDLEWMDYDVNFTPRPGTSTNGSMPQEFQEVLDECNTKLERRYIRAQA